MTASAPSVRSTSIRVALATTAIVGAAYLVVCAVIVGLVTVNLTRQVDTRLVDALARIENGPRPNGGRAFDAPAGGRPFGPLLLVWTIEPDGTVLSNTANAALPAIAATASSPTTVAVNGIDVRIAGVEMPIGHVIVGQSLEPVAQAQSTVMTAELLIAPLLLLIVFLGAVAIGRRVAAPIESARRRQMEFTADASHELRTPLSVIEAQTSLALAQDRPAEWYRTAFGRVGRESARMRGLVEDMLWLARFDAAQGNPVAELVDLGILAGGAVDRFAGIAESRGLGLSLDVAPGAWVVSAPPEWLDRLLGVLVDNACRYASDRGHVRVAVRGEDGRVVLSVDDDGPGIPEIERERIFDRFHRATGTPGGSGLGLAIGDAVVRATGGRWRVGRSPMGGASLAVSWPRFLKGEGQA